nr:hypothetical protein [Tanacetum cinerariifolium]
MYGKNLCYLDVSLGINVDKDEEETLKNIIVKRAARCSIMVGRDEQPAVYAIKVDGFCLIASLQNDRLVALDYTIRLYSEVLVTTQAPEERIGDIRTVITEDVILKSTEERKHMIFMEIAAAKTIVMISAAVPSPLVNYVLAIIVRNMIRAIVSTLEVNLTPMPSCDVQQENREDGDIGGKGEDAPNMLTTLMKTSRIHGSIPLLINQFLHKNSLVTNDIVEVADLTSKDIGSPSDELVMHLNQGTIYIVFMTQKMLKSLHIHGIHESRVYFFTKPQSALQLLERDLPRQKWLKGHEALMSLSLKP